MRKNISKIGIAFTFAAMLAMTGCGDASATTTINDAETPTSASADAGYVDALNEEAATEDVVINDEEYVNANNWSVRYDPSVITINEGGPVTTFVYTGDCAGTCMITTTYGVDNDGKGAAEDLAKSWGDQATVSDVIFPGTEDVQAYYVDAVPGQLGPGMYQSAYVRDYMDGYLIFECTDHMSGDDEIDTPVSDALAGIIDSLKFN